MTEDRLAPGLKALRSGDRRAARRIFGELVRKDPDNVAAWWYLAAAVDDVEQQIDCLQQVLRLRPDHSEARQKLQALERRVARPTPPKGMERPPVYGTREWGDKLVVVPEAGSGRPLREEGTAGHDRVSDLTVMTIAVLVALCAVVGVVVLVWTGAASDWWGVEGPALAATLRPLAFDVPACAATADDSATLVFINNTSVVIDILRGPLGEEEHLTTLAPDAQYVVEVESGVPIRYAVEAQAEGFASAGATLEVPSGNTCRVPIR